MPYLSLTLLYVVHRLAPQSPQRTRRTNKESYDCSGKHKHESTSLLFSQPEQGGKGLVELKTLYMQEHQVNNSQLYHQLKRPAYQNRKVIPAEKRTKSFRFTFKDAKTYAEELSIECDFNDSGAILRTGDKEMRVRDKELRESKEHYKQVNTDRHMKNMQNLKPWVRKFVTQHWCDCQISNKSYGIFKQWKNIPDIAMSSDSSIRQQPLNAKTWRSQKLQKQLEELSRRFCFEIQETASHVLCGCLQIAHSLYKTKHDKMLRPVYHATLEINLD